LPSLVTPSCPCSLPPCCADYRRPPAFPTRRSSDLVVGERRTAAQGAVERGDLLAQAHEVVVERGGDAGAEGLHRGVVGLARLSLDRKSTRLNSSHVKISYAVFCLKKKSSTAPTSAT